MNFNSWLVQSTGLRNRSDVEERIVRGLRAAHIPFRDFGIVPFTSSITGWDSFPTCVPFMYGSVKMLEVLTNQAIDATSIFVGAADEHAASLRKRLCDGLFWNREAFDQAQYAKHSELKSAELLLNSDATLHSLAKIAYERFDFPMFAKPSNDLKLFSGGVIEAGQSLFDFVQRNQVTSRFLELVDTDEKIVIASVKEILSEWRFFVVDGKPVAWSQYMDHGQLKPSAEVPEWIIDEAKWLAKVYQPADAFVMDICLLPSGDVKIVEYNCINCSGSYHANFFHLAKALS